MAKINTLNYQTVAAWNGSQDLFVVEQPDGTKVATPAMVKQFMQAGDFEATGEIKDGHGNILADMAKTDEVKGLAEDGDFEAAGEVKDGLGNKLSEKIKASDLGNLVVSEYMRHSNSTSIPAGGYAAIDIPINKSGYTPIGIVGISGSGTGKLSIMEFFVRQNTAKIYYMNSTQNAITPTYIDAYVLFVKN